MFSRKWQTRLVRYMAENQCTIHMTLEADPRWWVAAINWVRTSFGMRPWIANDRREEAARLAYDILTSPRKSDPLDIHEPF